MGLQGVLEGKEMIKIFVSAWVVFLIVHTAVGQETINAPTHNSNMTGDDPQKIFGSRIDPVGRDQIVENRAAYFISESGYTSIPQVCDIYENLTKKWIYKQGPETGDYGYLKNASMILSLSYKGDCNEFAILMASMVKSISGATRIMFGRGPEKSHAWAEVYIGNINKDKESVKQICNWLKEKYDIKEINLDLDPSSGETWLNLDWGEDWSKPAVCPGGSPKFNAPETKVVIADRAVKGLQTSPLSNFTISCRTVNATLNEPSRIRCSYCQ